MLDQKGPNLDQKTAQNGWGKIFPDLYYYFPKEEHMNSFYTKNQQNSMNHLEDINQNVDFEPERSKFGPKRAQNW